MANPNRSLTKYYSKLENLTPVDTTTYTNGKVDAKGRVLGVMVKTWECDAVEGPAPEEGYQSGHNLAPGAYFCARIQATKNGKPWGATQPTQYFTTQDERRKAIVKRIK